MLWKHKIHFNRFTSTFDPVSQEKLEQAGKCCLKNRFFLGFEVIQVDCRVIRGADGDHRRR